MDIWKQTIQKDIDDMKTDIRLLQDKQLLQDQSIMNIQTDLKEIKEDTKWHKRTITNAIIPIVLGGLITAAITVVFTVFKG